MQSSTKIQADIDNKDYYKIKIPPEMKEVWEYLKKLPGDNYIVGTTAINLVKYNLNNEPYVPTEDIDIACVGGEWQALKPFGFWQSRKIKNLYTLKKPYDVDLTTVFKGQNWMYYNVGNRDLTSCSIYISIKDECIYDPTGKGIKDILTNTLRMINDPDFLLYQGPERVLRVFKHMIKNIDPTLDAALEDALKNFSEKTPLTQHVLAAATKIIFGYDQEKLDKFMEHLKNYDMLKKLFKIEGSYDDVAKNIENIKKLIDRHRANEIPDTHKVPTSYLPIYEIRQTPLTNEDIAAIIAELKAINKETLEAKIRRKELKKKLREEKRQAQEQAKTLNNNNSIEEPSQEELEAKRLKREMKKLKLKEEKSKAQDEKRKQDEKRAQELAQQEALLNQQRAEAEEAKKQAKALERQTRIQLIMEAKTAQLDSNTNDKHNEADIKSIDNQTVVESQPQVNDIQTEKVIVKKAKKKKAKEKNNSNAAETSSQASSTDASLSTPKAKVKTTPQKIDNTKSIVKKPVAPKSKISIAEKKRPIYMSRLLIGDGNTASVMIALSSLKMFQKNYDKFIECLNLIINTNYVVEALKQLTPSLETEELKKINNSLLGFFDSVQISHIMPAKLSNLDPMLCFDKSSADDVIEHLFNTDILNLFSLEIKEKEYDNNLMHSIINSLNPGFGRYTLPPKEYKEMDNQLQATRFKLQQYEKEALHITLKVILKKKLANMKAPNHKFALSADEINELKASWQAVLPVQNNNSAYQPGSSTLFAQQNTTHQIALVNNSQLSPQ